MNETINVTLDQIRNHRLIDDAEVARFAAEKMDARNWSSWTPGKRCLLFAVIFTFLLILFVLLEWHELKTTHEDVSLALTASAFAALVAAAILTGLLTWPMLPTRETVDAMYGLKSAGVDELRAIQKYVAEAPELVSVVQFWLQQPTQIRNRDVEMIRRYVQQSCYDRTVASVRAQLAGDTP